MHDKEEDLGNSSSIENKDKNNPKKNPEEISIHESKQDDNKHVQSKQSLQDFFYNKKTGDNSSISGFDINDNHYNNNNNKNQRNNNRKTRKKLSLSSLHNRPLHSNDINYDTDEDPMSPLLRNGDISAQDKAFYRGSSPASDISLFHDHRHLSSSSTNNRSNNPVNIPNNNHSNYIYNDRLNHNIPTHSQSYSTKPDLYFQNSLPTNTSNLHSLNSTFLSRQHRPNQHSPLIITSTMNKSPSSNTTHQKPAMYGSISNQPSNSKNNKNFKSRKNRNRANSRFSINEYNHSNNFNNNEHDNTFNRKNSTHSVEERERGLDDTIIDFGDDNAVYSDSDYDSHSMSDVVSQASDSNSSFQDVCFPIDSSHMVDPSTGEAKRWPDISFLESFAEEERTEHLAAYTQLDDADIDPQDVDFDTNSLPFRAGLPNRFSYFREDFGATIHSPTIYGLLAKGNTFSDLFSVQTYAYNIAQRQHLQNQQNQQSQQHSNAKSTNSHTPVSCDNFDNKQSNNAVNNNSKISSNLNPVQSQINFQNAQHGHSSSHSHLQNTSNNLSKPLENNSSNDNTSNTTNNFSNSHSHTHSQGATATRPVSSASIISPVPSHSSNPIHPMIHNASNNNYINSQFDHPHSPSTLLHPVPIIPGAGPTNNLFNMRREESNTALNNTNNNNNTINGHNLDIPNGNQDSNTQAGSNMVNGIPTMTQPGYYRDVQFTSLAPPFWLDICNPTEAEMKVLGKAFGIHPLTMEDIMLGETREKVELFRSYYLACFRSFKVKRETVLDWPANSKRRRTGSVKSDNLSLNPNRKSTAYYMNGELVPISVYVVVFKDGVLSFHHSPCPHPANVRRRIRQLKDYLTVSADWISYALIDDITDHFGPIIDSTESEVISIDEAILRMHSGEDDDDSKSFDEKKGSQLLDHESISSSSTSSSFHWKQKGDMLRQIGECRKRVMTLLRLIGTKADVLRSFAKRCNEQWESAPRTEIALYLGDIQDHVVTMSQALSHYEKVLARCHSNYLAQLNIDMTRVNNDTNDVLGRLTVLGTIVLPMNIITGLWGMNVQVPGQDDVDSLTWFYMITGSLILFGCSFFFLFSRIYGL